MKEILPFLPLRLIKISQVALSYLVSSILKYWWLFIPFSCIVSFCIYKYFNVFFITHQIETIIFCILMSSIPGLIFGLKQDFKIRKYKLSDAAITINNSLVIKNDEYLDIDINSPDILLKLSQQVNYINSHYISYKNGFLNVLLVSRKRIFYLFKDTLGLKSFLSREIEKNKILASLLIIKNEATAKIEFDVIFIPTPQFDSIRDFINTFSNLTIENQGFNKDYIIEVAKIFITIYATGSLNLHSNENQHKILDDNRKIMLGSLENIVNKIKPVPVDGISRFKNGWECEFERIRSIVLIEQKEYYGAARHVFNAIKLNPFHPYHDYEEFKEEYSLKNASEFSKRMIEVGKDLKKAGEENIDNFNEEEMKNKGAEIYGRRRYPEMPLFQEIICQIIKEASSEKLNKVIEAFLDTDFCESPMKELIKGDCIKYIPTTNKEKIQELYIERFPAIIQCYRNVLSLDPNFSYMYVKLSSILFMYSTTLSDDNMIKKLVEESMELFNKGIDMYARLGLMVRSQKL